MKQYFTELRELIRGFASAMNLISPEVQNHHQQVAYLACRLARQLQMPENVQQNMIYAGLLHDVGSIILGPDSTLIQLEKNPFLLTRKSAEILQLLPQTKQIASILNSNILTRPNLLRPMSSLREIVDSGLIVRTADYVSLQIKPDIPILNQAAKIADTVRENEHHFGSRIADAFLELSQIESVWLDLVLRPDAFLDYLPVSTPLTLEHTQSLTEVMSLIIDFRSPFTAMHSAGVAATAAELARLTGMSEEEQMLMRIAGNLHDLGKLKIPREILEKPGRLTTEEFNIIKEHAYYTTIFLQQISGFEELALWAGLHHEKLNGNGYPFRLTSEKIPYGSRIMACADIFSAITEERPYRKGMPKDQVIRIMQENVDNGSLSHIIVECLLDNYDTIDVERDRQSHIAGRRYFESIRQSADEKDH